LGFGFTVGLGVGCTVGVGLLEGVVLVVVLEDGVSEGLVSLAATSEHPARTNDSTTAPATRPRRRDTGDPSPSLFNVAEAHRVSA
jgi:hypothetical protein